jgi:hypothetical protein
MPKDNKPPIFEVLDQVKLLRKEVQDVKTDLQIIKAYIKDKQKRERAKEEARQGGWFY